MKMGKLLSLLCTVMCLSFIGLPGAQGHAYLATPAARNAKWRCGFPEAEPNYDLTGLSAGGPATVRGAGLGHGACGDSVRGDQPHLEGGRYTRDKSITGHYRPNEEFDVTVQVTAYHSGWFEFNLCPIGVESLNWDMQVTQECLNRYQLQRADGHGHRYWINSGDTGQYTIRLKMPNIECERCVLQYYWQTANSGCGANSEEFWNCADISVKSSYSDVGPTAPVSSSCVYGPEMDTSRDNGCPGYDCPREYDPDGFTTSSPCIGPSPNPYPEGSVEYSSSSSSSEPQPGSSSSSSSSSTPPPPQSSSSSEPEPSSSSSSSSSSSEPKPEPSSSSSSSSSSSNDNNEEASCEGKPSGNYCYGDCSLNYYTCLNGYMFPNRPVAPGTACIDGVMVNAYECSS